jgi:hypothetical protein
MWFAPMVSKTIASSYAGDRISMTQVAHTFISPNKNGGVTLDVPYAHCENYLATERDPLHDEVLTDSIGSFGISVFAPLLASTTASSTIHWTLSVSITDAEFHLPRPIPLVLSKGEPARVFHGGGSSKKGDTNIVYNISGGTTTITSELGDEYDQGGGS